MLVPLNQSKLIIFNLALTRKHLDNCTNTLSTAENVTCSFETALLSKEQDRQTDSSQVSSSEIDISLLFESGRSDIDINLPSLFELEHLEIDFQSLFQLREPSDRS